MIQIRITTETKGRLSTFAGAGRTLDRAIWDLLEEHDRLQNNINTAALVYTTGREE